MTLSKANDPLQAITAGNPLRNDDDVDQMTHITGDVARSEMIANPNDPLRDN
jgi:hypothetical protein